MLENSFIHIKSAKFPILPGEEDELVNPGNYGKSFAQYLAREVGSRGYDAAFICCEDWGWWVELRGQPFTLGLCIYGSPSLDQNHELCVSLSTEPGKIWSWRKLRFIDTTPYVSKLFHDLDKLLTEDIDIEIIGYPEEFPLEG
jgi:hypothetical protein